MSELQARDSPFEVLELVVLFDIPGRVVDYYKLFRALWFYVSLSTISIKPGTNGAGDRHFLDFLQPRPGSAKLEQKTYGKEDQSLVIDSKTMCNTFDEQGR